jgi:hypothetical protein
VALAGAVWADDAIHRLDVRPGMWESTMTVQMTGTPPIPAEVLARMTPEQKAMMEARMKARESQNAKPNVTRHCITREDLDKPLNFGETKGACKRAVVTSSGTKQEIHLECEMSGVTSTGTVKIEAVDAEHVKVLSHITAGTMIVDANGSGKWVSEACDSTAGK